MDMDKSWRLMFSLGYISGGNHIFYVENALVVDIHICSIEESHTTFKMEAISSRKVCLSRLEKEYLLYFLFFQKVYCK